jgi:hypothetical protein
MLTKKDMVSRIVKLYGKDSKIAIWFMVIALNSDYKRTWKIFFKIIRRGGLNLLFYLLISTWQNF